MTTKFGDFAAPIFNSGGDKYIDREKPSERDQGLNFKATVARRGKVSAQDKLPAAQSATELFEQDSLTCNRWTAEPLRLS